MKSVSVLSNICPKCHQGKLFRFFFFLNKRCEHCGFKFEKEEGYFFGPMIISYFLTFLIAVPFLVIAVFKYQVDIGETIAPTVFYTMIIGPIFYRYSKLIWLHAETAFDEKMQKERERADELVQQKK